MREHRPVNLISTSCVGSFITSRIFNQEFINPFCWTSISTKDMINLIDHYDDLNFQNYKLVKDENWKFSIIIDDCVKVVQYHYIFDPKCEQITSDGVNVCYARIWEYIVKKYNERVKKFLGAPEPIFILGCVCEDRITVEDIYRVLNSKSPYKIIIATPHKGIDWKNTDKREFIELHDSLVKEKLLGAGNDYDVAKFIYDNSMILQGIQ